MDWTWFYPPNGGGDGRFVHIGSEYLRLLPKEHGNTIPWNQSHYGPVSSGRGTPLYKGVKVVVVYVALGHGRVTDTSPGGRNGRGGGRGFWGKYLWLRQRDYCRVFSNLGTEPSAPLYYAPGLEHCHPTMSILGGHGGRLKR